MLRMRWRPQDRIRTSREFQNCLRRRPHRCDHLLIYVRRSRCEHSRLGLIVGRKVGKAVTRNLIRRRVREAFRTHRHLFPEPVDVLVRALPGSGTLSMAECAQALRSAVAQAVGRPNQPQRPSCVEPPTCRAHPADETR